MRLLHATPGMLATAQGLLDENPSPTREQVRETLSGNICRCTGYQTIVDAVMDVAAQRSAAEPASRVPSEASHG
jgi:carbon-monoxide dehydrogenase small subunit